MGDWRGDLTGSTSRHALGCSHEPILNPIPPYRHNLPPNVQDPDGDYPQGADHGSPDGLADHRSREADRRPIEGYSPLADGVISAAPEPITPTECHRTPHLRVRCGAGPSGDHPPAVLEIADSVSINGRRCDRLRTARSADMARLVRIDRSRWSLARELLSSARTEGSDPVIVAHDTTSRLPGRCVGMPMTDPGRPPAQASAGMCPSCESNVYWS
jgi:hypothetical protein